MACESWSEKLDTCLDGELSVAEARAVHEHLRDCSGCAAESVARLQQKRAVRNAGQRFAPDPALRARIHKTVAGPATASPWRRWIPLFAMTAAMLLLAGAFLLQRDPGDERQLSELVDQHVATLASANPVDVISTDRHTVKPWFEGRIPFAFNLPELQGSEFTLVGGKVSYLGQSPGAELIFRVRKHQISVFIFQEREHMDGRENDAAKTALSFEVRSWSQNRLRYFVIGDASARDLDQLTQLLKAAT